MVNQRVHFELDDPATEALIPAMLDDIPVEGEQVRRATTQWAKHRMKEDDEFEAGDLQIELAIFKSGYQQCLVDQGLLEPDGLNTLPAARADS